jgi:uncharacterized protein YqhQ
MILTFFGVYMKCKINSGIGGQAVLEGIMMRNKDKYAIAVRKPDKEIAVKIENVKGGSREGTWKNLPIIRGIFSFVESLVMGMNCLMYSAQFFEDEEELEKQREEEKGLTAEEVEKLKKKREKDESAAMTFALVIAVVLAVAVFMIAPYYISSFFSRWISSKWAVSAIEAVIRVILFLVYIAMISHMKDIQRTFMYHGAEHKCINCIENGLELNVENVMKSSRLHKRCGTSFLFFVIIVSIVFIMFIQVDSHVLRIVIRLALLPLIAGVSYEIIRWAGSSDNKFVNLLSKPGMGLQKMTTKEPDESMVEVAITAVEAVFDWREFLDKNFKNERIQYSE